MIRKYVYITILCMVATIIYADNQLAIAFYKSGQPSVAKRLLEQEVINDSSNPGNGAPILLAEAYYYLGEIAFDAQQVPESRSYYQKGWDASHDYPYNKIGEGKVLLSSDKAAAENAFNEAIKIDKKNAKVYITIAAAYHLSKMDTEAASYQEKALKQNAKDPAIFIYEGDLLFASGKPGDAAGKYEQAIYFDPDCIEAYLKYANVYQNVTPSLAITMLEKVLASHPDYLLAYNALGNIYSQQGQYNKAINAYKAYIDGNLYSPDDLVHYASALFFNKQYPEAAGIIEKGLSLAPDNFLLQRLNMYNAYETKAYDAGMRQANSIFNASNEKFIWQDYLYYGRLLNATKQYEQALKNLQKVLTLTDSHNEVYQDLASVYANLGDNQQAVFAYSKYISSFDKSQIATSDYYQLGVYYYTAAISDSADVVLSNSNLQKADSTFTLVTERVPESYLGYLWKARTNSMLDPETEQGLAKPFYDSCIQILEKNGERKKELAECYRYLGYYYYQKKDMTSSKLYWNKVLEIDPTNKIAQEAIQNIR